MFAAFVLTVSVATAAPSIEPTEQQATQLAAIRAARTHGLDPENYGLREIEASVARVDAEAFAALIEQSFGQYAADLRSGRTDPNRMDPDWHLTAPERTTDESMAGAQSGAPPYAAYQRLQEAMLRYLAIERLGGWPELTAGPALSVGVRDAQVQAVRDRLRLTGDFAGDAQADAWFFGSGLDHAVRRFQARHGLQVNGVIDAATRAAMNVPVDTRITQLAVAMERWRWLPRDLGSEFVWVNVPQLAVEVVESGETKLTVRAIVGHSSRPTPSMASEIRQIVFNPSWYVPRSIATEDLLPKLKKDPEFAERNRFQVIGSRGDEQHAVDPASIDWGAVSARDLSYRFVQQPGEGNSLGRVKFVFDNPFDIYLHDTPAKGLFALRTRTFSSGCVRLEQADSLADYLLANNYEPSDTTMAQWLESSRTRAVNLTRRLPIYVVYITSWVDETGVINFRRDLYGRDVLVAEALQPSRSQLRASGGLHPVP